MAKIELEVEVPDDDLEYLDKQSDINSNGRVKAKDVIQNFTVQAIADLDLHINHASCKVYYNGH